MLSVVHNVEATKSNGAEATVKSIVPEIHINVLSRIPAAIVLLCYVVVSFLTAVSLFSYALKRSVALEGLMDALLLAACGILLIGLFILLLGRWRHDLPKAFLLVAAPSAMVFGLLILPDQVPDEIWHIYRVLNFTESGNGGMIAPDALMYLQTPTTYPEMYEAILAPGDWTHTHIVDRDMSSYLSHLYTIPGVAAAVRKHRLVPCFWICCSSSDAARQSGHIRLFTQSHACSAGSFLQC